MNDQKHYSYAFEFPESSQSIVDRFGLTDIQQSISEISKKYIPHGIPNLSGEYPCKKNLIIKTANHPWEILSVQSLSEIFQTTDTSVLFFMPKGYPFIAKKNYPYSVEEIATVEKLMAIVQAMQPKNIYLQVSPHTKSEYLVILFHHLFPQINLTTEFYDMGMLFSDSIQKDSRGYNDQDILESCVGSWIAMNHCKANVVKSAGDDWVRFANTCPAPSFTIFPMLDDDVLVKSGLENETLWVPQKIKRILYAGSVTSSELQIGPQKTPGANFLKYFEEISHSIHTLNIYNAAHKTISDEENPKFSLLKSWINKLSGSINYHSSIPQKDLIKIQATHDLGFFCVHYAEDKVEHVGRLAIPNRVMSYICSGLPIIVDTRAEFIANLVKEFNAGILIDPAIDGDLQAKINNSNISLLRAGVHQLRTELIRRNKQQLNSLKAKIVNGS